MSRAGPVAVERLRPGDLAPLRAAIALFAEAFEETQADGAAPPSDAWLAALLDRADFVALVARTEGGIVGALTAYVLPKPERARTELYLYDLAVAEAFRRRGVATALIAALTPIAQAHGASIIFVQADPEDAPAVALYAKLGRRHDAVHFDIPVRTR